MKLFRQSDDGGILILGTVLTIPLLVLGLLILDFCHARGLMQSIQQAADLACIAGATVADEQPHATEELMEHVFMINAPDLESVRPHITVLPAQNPRGATRVSRCHPCPPVPPRAPRRVEMRVTYAMPALTLRTFGSIFSFLRGEIRSAAEQRPVPPRGVKAVLVAF